MSQANIVNETVLQHIYQKMITANPNCKKGVTIDSKLDCDDSILMWEGNVYHYGFDMSPLRKNKMT